MLCILSIPYKEYFLSSDKYNHNKLKHPLGGLILNTDDEVFLHLITYFSNAKAFHLFCIKYVMKKRFILITVRAYFIFTSHTNA